VNNAILYEQIYQKAAKPEKRSATIQTEITETLKMLKHQIIQYGQQKYREGQNSMKEGK
jgi:hypothetical protein